MISAAGTLLERATPVALAAGCESVTIQFAELAAVRVVLSHWRAEMVLVLAPLTVMVSDVFDDPMKADKVAT